MKALHLWTTLLIATVFGLFLALQAPGAAMAGTGDRVLTGELVVTNASRNQFRLVEQQGSFTAPAGTSVQELDGKPVQVEFGGDGRVLQISPMSIHIDPITHGFEQLSGELVLADPLTHTFAIAGDGRTFVAPQGIDIGQYAGHVVAMRLDEQGRVMEINLIGRAADAPVARPLRGCMLGNTRIAGGASICQGGRTFRCADNGEWVNLGTPCSEPALR